MTKSRWLVVAVAPLALAMWAPVTWSAATGDSGFQDNSGRSFFSASPPCPVKEFPTFESIAPVPAIIDPFEQDIIPVFCGIQVRKQGKPVNKARGTFDADLIVLNNDTGDFGIFPLDSGKFKTNSSGIANLDFEIPAPLFADGFESGDVSAWSYTRADFRNKKKADNATMSCDIGSSKSSNSRFRD